MGRVTEVVKHLIIINVIMHVAFHIIMPHLQDNVFMHYPRFSEFPSYSEFNKFQPYQIVTHMFMHANMMHILFNMMGLYFLGPMVEQRLGSKRFLALYLICGFGSLFLHIAMTYFGLVSPNSVMMGASGAVMGVFISFAMLFPDVKLMLLFPPIPIKAKYLMIGLVAFDLFSGIGGVNTGIAHFAHLGGAICGFILIMLWKNSGSNFSM